MAKTAEIVKSEGVERLVVGGVSKVAVFLPPLGLWLLFLPPLGAVSHMLFGDPPAVIWVTMGSTTLTMLLTGLTWLISHARNVLGRVHSTVTTLAVCLWFTIVTVTGFTATFTLASWFIGGLGLCASWWLRKVIRSRDGDDGGRTGGSDPLKSLFDRSKESFGLKGAQVKTTKVTDRKIEADLELDAGHQVVDDLVKKAKYIESGMGLPPGSVNVTGSRDRADRAFVSLSDPRLMDAMIPWPGPSRPGGSVIEPLRVGCFQDASDVEPELPPNNVQVMGASGSGKSLFAAWNLFAELITRRDVACFGVDLAKDIQTFRPLRPAMYGTHITKAKAIEFIDKLHELIPQRTRWLSERGFSDWQPGCGLLFWFVDFEEVADIFDELPQKSQDKIEAIAKKIRSAGGRLMMSLQRSTHTEMPTIVRSQMAFWCFGLNDKDDNEYGLSDAQQLADVNPAQWGAGKKEHIGKAFIDCAGIPDTHIAMPMRAFAFGDDVNEATANLAAHAAEWPATGRPIDPFTLELAMVDDDFAARLQSAGGPVMLEPDQKATAAPEPDAREPLAEDLGDLLAHAAELVVTAQHASSAMLSRKLRVGHEAALQILAALEMKGVVGPQPADGDRKVLLAADDAEGLVDALKEDGFPIADYLRTEDPDPDVVAGPYDPIRTPTLAEDPFHTTTAQEEADKRARKLPPEQARAVVHAWIRGQGVGAVFTATCDDLTRIRQDTGNTSRSWMNKVLNELVDQGALDKDTGGPAHRFTVADLGPLGREMADA